ncbi:MAG: SDR family oxidoreductase [Spirochaetota bacterium]
MIILSGSHTLMGNSLLPLLRDEYQVCAFDDERGDIKDRDFLEKLCSEIRPSLFINCAQVDNVEECEYKREEAYTLNGKVPSYIADICACRKISLIHLSSHYVFDGEGDAPFAESAPLRPKTVYGDSKALAEKNILSSGADSLIVRLPSVYGRGDSFLSPYIQKMKTGEAIPVIGSQLIMPTYAADAAQMILSLIRQNARGIIHCGNEGITGFSQFLYEVANSYSKAAGKGMTVNLQPYDVEEYLSPCDLSVNNCLDLTRLKKETENIPRHWKDALDDFVLQNHSFL